MNCSKCGKVITKYGVLCPTTVKENRELCLDCVSEVFANYEKNKTIEQSLNSILIEIEWIKNELAKANKGDKHES